MNNAILDQLDISPTVVESNRIVNLYTKNDTEPFGFVSFNNGHFTAHFGYYQSLAYKRVILHA